MLQGSLLTAGYAMCRGTATAAGVLLRSWDAGGEGSAAILLDWERNVLEAIFEGGPGRDLATTTDLDPDSDGQRRVGGPVSLRPGEPLTVRALLPASAHVQSSWSTGIRELSLPDMSRARLGKRYAIASRSTL